MSNRTKVVEIAVKDVAHCLESVDRVTITAVDAGSYLPWSISFRKGELKIWIRRDRYHAALPFEGEKAIVGLRDALIEACARLEIGQDADE